MFDRLSDLNRRAFLDGVKTLSPAVPATFSWGLVTGIAMAKSVLTVPQALGMSLAAYAGSSQLAVLPLFAAKLPLWTILLTAAMVNLRFVIFSAGSLRISPICRCAAGWCSAISMATSST